MNPNPQRGVYLSITSRKSLRIDERDFVMDGSESLHQMRPVLRAIGRWAALRAMERISYKNSWEQTDPDKACEWTLAWLEIKKARLIAEMAIDHAWLEVKPGFQWRL